MAPGVTRGMNTPKRHHFVPQMLLRRFSAADGSLYFHRREMGRGTVAKISTRKLFVEKNLYNQIGNSGNIDYSIEKELAILEGEANSIIDYMIMRVERGNKPKLSREKKAIWDRFFYVQWKRTPNVLDRTITFSEFEQSYVEALEEFEEKYRPLMEHERQELMQEEVMGRVRHNARAMSVAAPSQMVTQVLRRKGLEFIVNRTDEPFVIGSNPISRIESFNQTHLESPMMRAWLPLSSRIAVSPAYQKGIYKISVEKAKGKISAINRNIVSQSDGYASESKDLIEKMARLYY